MVKCLPIVCLSFFSLGLSVSSCTKKTPERPVVDAPELLAPLPTSTNLPTEVIGALIAHTPKTTIAAVEKLAALAGPVPPGVIMAALQRSLADLGIQKTEILDLDKPAGVVFFEPGRGLEPVVFLATKGEKETLSAIQGALKEKELKDGIHELTREEADTYQAFGGKKSLPRAGAASSVFARFQGPMVVLAPQRESLQAFPASLLDSLTATGGRGISGVLRLGGLKAAYGPQWKASLEMLSSVLTGQTKTNKIPLGETTSKFMSLFLQKMYAGFLQIQEITFSLDAREAGLALQFGWVPEKDSRFAQLLAGQVHKPLTLFNALPQDGFLTMAGNVQWDAFKEGLRSFIREMFQLFGNDPLIAEIASLTDKWLDVMGEEFAVAENLGDGLSLVELIAVKDEAQTKALMDAMLAKARELFNSPGMKTTLQDLPMHFDPPKALGEYKGTALGSFAMAFDFKNLPGTQAEMFKRLYGEKLQMVYAVTHGTLALAMGKDAEKQMKELIDRLSSKSAGATRSRFIQVAQNALGPDPGGFMVFSLSELMASSLQAATAMLKPGQKAPSLPASKSGMVIGLSSKPERWTWSFVLPAEHLKEVGEAFKLLMQSSLGGSPQ